MKIKSGLINKLAAQHKQLGVDATIKIADAIDASIERLGLSADISLINKLAAAIELGEFIISRRLDESVSVADLQQTYVGKILSDTSLLTEAMSANIEQVKSESLSASDNVIVALTFYRTLSDAFAIDDAISLERNYGITKQNVASASDAHYWATTKAVIDSASASDSLSAAIEKPLTEAMSASDALSYAAHYRPAYRDEVSVSDFFAVGTDATKNNAANASDTHYLSATKAVMDAAAALDSASVNIGQVRADAAKLKDKVTVSSHYHRILADAVAMYDAMVLSGRELSSTSLANATDAHYWATTKRVTDTTLALDSASTVLEKPLTDAMSTLDTFSYAAQYRRALEDVLSVSDIMLISDLDIGSISLANIRDQHALSINTNYADAASLSDVHSFTASKALTESIGATDYVSFQFTNDKKPVFNGVTFNTSTFG